MDEFLRYNPELKPVHAYNLFNRLLEASDNTLMLLYDVKRDLYEVHSLKSWKYNGESMNAVLEDDMITGWLIHDFRANDVNKFGLELQGERELHNAYLDSQENKGFELLTTRTLKTIETMIGRDL